MPEEVRRSILSSLPSVPFLEALLLLRAERSRGWDSHRVAGRLSISEGEAVELLQDLAQAGVARRSDDGVFAYAPATPALDGLLEHLSSAYAQGLVGVTDLIHSRPDRRTHQLAEAFRWSRED